MAKPPLDQLIMFRQALEEVSRIADIGATKHGAKTWRKLFIENPDANTASMLRHLFAAADGELRDKDDGFINWAAVAFRALAMCQLMLELEGVPAEGVGCAFREV